MSKQGNSRSKKATISYVVDDELEKQINDYVKATGIRKSDMNRAAMRKFMDEGHKDALVMLNLVQLVQVVSDIQTEVKTEQLKQLQNLTENLMQIKGGK